jgi:hypothetical protein
MLENTQELAIFYPSSKKRGSLAAFYFLDIRPGGLSSVPRLKKQYRPIDTAGVFGWGTGFPPPDDDWDGALVRTRSPRIMTSGWMTALPPSMMF